MSTETEIPEAEVVPDSRELATVPATELSATTPVTATDLVERLGTIEAAMQTAMTKDIDYGLIPGAQKPCLFKPGAEKLAVLFQLDVQTTHDERWGPGDHLTVPAKSIVYHAPSGVRVGSGEGMCSTREKKYAKRKQERTCPECGMAAVVKGKKEFGGGWLCFKKKDGCGAKWPDGDPVIEGQEVGEIDNPDLPDLWNTVIKMARKRALVDAVLLVTGASALFTQDVEDMRSNPHAAETDPEPTLPLGPEASPEQIASARKAIGYLLDETPGSDPVTEIVNAIEKAGGYLPHFALAQVTRVAGAVRARDNGPVETPEDRQEREHAESLMEAENA